MNQNADAMSATTRPHRQATVRIAASTLIAAIAVTSVVSCKRQFSPVGRLRDSGFTYGSPVSVQISVGTSGWMVTAGGGAAPQWNARISSVSLAAPVSGQEVNPFVGPTQPNTTTPFEFVPGGAQYLARFRRRQTFCQLLNGEWRSP